MNDWALKFDRQFNLIVNHRTVMKIFLKETAVIQIVISRSPFIVVLN